MIPPNPFQSSSSSSSANNMPGSSFLPAIPASLPSYPKHHSFLYSPPAQTQSAQSPSPTLAPTRKRLQQRRPADTPPSSYSNTNNYDSDEDVMRNSLYSDTAFRTSLAGSRKRGLADDDAEDGPRGKRVEMAGDDGRPAAKRRIIDVVGSVASRVWEFCISKTPFYSGVEENLEGKDEMAFERDVQRHMKTMPGGYSNPQFQLQGSGEAGNGMGMQQNYFASAPSPSTYCPPEVVQQEESKQDHTGGLSSRWVMVSPTPVASTASSRPATATHIPLNAASRIPRPYTAPNIYTTPPYSPTIYATTATSTTTATATVTQTNATNGAPSRTRRNSTASNTSTSRRPPARPVVAASSRAKRPAVVRTRHSQASSVSAPGGYPAPPQSTFTFDGAPSSGRAGAASSASTRSSRRRLTGGSISDDDEDEADESIRRFNEKLKDMIREGREALGSRIEVTYDDDEDLEGF
ncbi:uncharacterized protein H6S33_001866 [Morchella sextelata]|uniref:uncharacterized protein n=1 Tax=Morchella sextelata TaxID=1174677 RepID=UPI001D044764|nr:uncharacterized protein H6S33_001866 [Morchella sextelata]KAH0608732.1 hypothetical protein H6S33_001866 [Morchella sextelata]